MLCSIIGKALKRPVSALFELCKPSEHPPDIVDGISDRCLSVHRPLAVMQHRLVVGSWMEPTNVPGPQECDAFVQWYHQINALFAGVRSDHKVHAAAFRSKKALLVAATDQIMVRPCACSSQSTFPTATPVQMHETFQISCPLARYLSNARHNCSIAVFHHQIILSGGSRQKRSSVVLST